MPSAPDAGNTNETLRPIDVMTAAIAYRSQLTPNLTPATESQIQSREIRGDVDELVYGTRYVTQEEFDELQELVLRMYERMDKFNQGSPHKI